MTDSTKIQMGSKTSSLKILVQGSGSLVVPSTLSTVTVTSTVPHNFGSDNLIWQVGMSIDRGGGFVSNNFTPYGANDGSLQVVSTIDSESLHIVGVAFTAGSATPVTTITYYYRVLVP